MSLVWEYRHLEINTGQLDQLESKLNALGSVGWELCGFASVDRTIGFNG